jgi:hypothetical protein
MMIDWMAVLKVAGYTIAAFGVGWGGAVLQELPMLKAIASGIIPACTYLLGNRQEKVDFKV